VDNEHTPKPARPQRSVAAAGRAWQWVVEGFAALGTALIGVLMVIICADIVARNLMGASLPLVSELGALLLVMIVSLQLATTIRADRLARTDLFLVGLKRSRPKFAALLSALFNLVGATIIGLIAYASIYRHHWHCHAADMAVPHVHPGRHDSGCARISRPDDL